MDDARDQDALFNGPVIDDMRADNMRSGRLIDLWCTQAKMRKPGEVCKSAPQQLTVALGLITPPVLL